MIFLSPSTDSPEDKRGTSRRRRLLPDLARRRAAAAVASAAAVVAGAAWAPVAGAALPAGCAADSDGSVDCAYAYTGGEQQFKVPSGVTAVWVRAVGAPGGQDLEPSPVAGGRGAVTEAVIPSTPGQVLFVEVGGAANGTIGGFNGGGNGGPNGGGGGGASDVRSCSTTAAACSGADNTLDSRLVVAGGGGGAGTSGDGSGGIGGDGAFPGSAGGNGAGGLAAPGLGGNGGTSAGGGIGGAGWGSTVPTGGAGDGKNGTAGSGGDGGQDPSGSGGSPLGGGGGGGGGWFGGGGGGGGDIYVRANPRGYSIFPGAAGGGGGGASYTIPTSSEGLGVSSAGESPSVSIVYTPAVPKVDSISPAALGQQATGVPVTVKGSNFDSPVKVRFSAPYSEITGTVKSSSPTSLNLAVTLKPGTPTGHYDMTVTGADGQVATCGGCLAVVAGPVLSNFTPFQATRGEKTTFTASGHNFSPDARLYGPSGVVFSALKVSSDETTITGTMSVAPTALTGQLLPVMVVDGPLGDYGRNKVLALTIS